jgi:hypothetical protein
MPFKVWYGGKKHSNNAESENGLRSIKTITALGNKEDLIGWRGGIMTCLSLEMAENKWYVMMKLQQASLLYL